MRYLIMGLGSIGMRHFENLTLIDKDAEFFTFRERNLKKVNGIKEFCNIQDALSQEYDAVFITNPTSKHASYALEFAKKGNNLFIEKPVSHNLENINELKKVVDDENLITFVGYNMRFHPAMQIIKEYIDNNKLGRLFFIRMQNGEYLPDWHPHENYKLGYSARKELGGGVVLTLSHEIDSLLWFNGKPKRVYAKVMNTGSLGIQVEDNAEIILDYGTFIAELNLNYLLRKHKRECVIIGEKGALYFDYHISMLSFFDNNVCKETIIWNDEHFERNAMYLAEMKHFISCIKEGERASIDLDEGIKTLDVCMAIYESSNKGKVIDIEYN